MSPPLHPPPHELCLHQTLKMWGFLFFNKTQVSIIQPLRVLEHCWLIILFFSLYNMFLHVHTTFCLLQEEMYQDYALQQIAGLSRCKCDSKAIGHK